MIFRVGFQKTTPCSTAFSAALHPPGLERSEFALRAGWIPGNPDDGTRTLRARQEDRVRKVRTALKLPAKGSSSAAVPVG